MAATNDTDNRVLTEPLLFESLDGTAFFVSQLSPTLAFYSSSIRNKSKPWRLGLSVRVDEETLF